MSENKLSLRLEDLPSDILGDILSRVAASSRTTIRHFMQASPRLAKTANDYRVYKAINLRPLALKPLAARNRYQDLMTITLANGNVEAHYIKGILEYFRNNNTIQGLHHLKVAAEGHYNEGIYLYGILLLCRGQIEEGIAYLEKLKWQQSKAKADQCWRNIKRSLHGLIVSRLPIYRTTLASVQQTIMCNRYQLDNRCNHCYYYKQMVKFVYVI